MKKGVLDDGNTFSTREKKVEQKLEGSSRVHKLRNKS